MLPQVLKKDEIISLTKEKYLTNPDVQFLGQLVFSAPLTAMPSFHTHTIIAFKAKGSEEVQFVKTTNLKEEKLSFNEFQELKFNPENEQDYRDFANSLGINIVSKPKLR